MESAAPFMPSTVPSRSEGVRLRSTAMPLGSTSAVAAPCRPRIRMSMGRFVASAETAEMAIRRTSPAIIMRIEPNASPSRPETGCIAATATRKTLISSVISPTPTSKCDRMEGRPTAIIVLFNGVSIAASATVAWNSMLRQPPSRISVESVVSGALRAAFPHVNDVAEPSRR